MNFLLLQSHWKPLTGNRRQPVGPHGLGKTESSVCSELYRRSQETWFPTLADQKLWSDIGKVKDYQRRKHYGNYLKPNCHFVDETHTHTHQVQERKWRAGGKTSLLQPAFLCHLSIQTPFPLSQLLTYWSYSRNYPRALHFDVIQVFIKQPHRGQGFCVLISLGFLPITSILRNSIISSHKFIPQYCNHSTEELSENNNNKMMVNQETMTASGLHGNNPEEWLGFFYLWPKPARSTPLLMWLRQCPCLSDLQQGKRRS